jgi:hypothetical protein
MPKSLRALLTALALSLAVAPAHAGPAPVEPAPELAQGDELEATRDVELRDATIRKGSRVRVVQVTREAGKVVAVSLELADGHVLRGVAYATVKASFKPASPQ